MDRRYEGFIDITLDEPEMFVGLEEAKQLFHEIKRATGMSNACVAAKLERDYGIINVIPGRKI